MLQTEAGSDSLCVLCCTGDTLKNHKNEEEARWKSMYVTYVAMFMIQL